MKLVAYSMNEDEGWKQSEEDRRLKMDNFCRTYLRKTVANRLLDMKGKGGNWQNTTEVVAFSIFN